MTSTSPAQRTWRPGWPCPAGAILLQQRRGGSDPTYRIDAGGRHWRGIGTPEGPATLCIEVRPTSADVYAEAWGPGAAWVLDGLPDLLGAADDVTGFDPQHPIVAEAWRRHPHWRLGRTGLVMESLVPTIVEQKVTGQEAFAGFRSLVQRFGEPAPGPVAELRLRVQPPAEVLRGIPSWDWLKAHIDPARSRTIVQASRVAGSLERLVGLTNDEVDRRLRSLPGVGVWTSAEVRAHAFGDADAVSFGDYHVATDVGHVLTGTAFDDAQLEEFLEPWRPHRGRVPALLAMARLGRPRRGPRMAPREHLPGRTPGVSPR